MLVFINSLVWLGVGSSFIVEIICFWGMLFADKDVWLDRALITILCFVVFSAAGIGTDNKMVKNGIRNDKVYF